MVCNKLVEVAPTEPEYCSAATEPPAFADMAAFHLKWDHPHPTPCFFEYEVHYTEKALN